MSEMQITNKLILITGAAKRVGRSLALSVAKAGGDVVIHYGHSRPEAEELQAEIASLGRKAYLLQADMSDADKVQELVPQAFEYGSVYALVNNAAIFESLSLETSTLESWNRHLLINLTVPFLLSQSFGRLVPPDSNGRIVNLLDWRALRPGADHLPYTISKAALAALTQALAVALAPRISVNGLALGAVLPPSSGHAPQNILDRVPARRWAELDEVGQALVFLLAGPAYITGEVIHIDGGRHLI